MKTKLFRIFAAACGMAGLHGLAADYDVTVDYNRDLGPIAPELIGFNAIYSNEPDAQWQNGTGNIPALLDRIGAKLVRFPAGTVVTFWHWTDPNVPGHTDSWDPHYPRAKDLPASAAMNIDEYLAFCRAKGATPLVGINLGSGRRWNRVSDGIAEARALVAHCTASGVNVVYYYLDNEPYAADANHRFTAAEYAEQINLYAPALRSVNPKIKLIANCHPGQNPTGYAYTRTVLQNAGANIDFVDIHCYWNHKRATFAHWIEQPHMLHQQTRPYSELRDFYRRMAADAGHPEIEFCTLEWNVGPPGAGNPEPTEAQCALMAGEELMQFIQSGVKLACCWPLHWERGDPHRALLSSARGYAPTKLYGMFRQFSTIGGRMQVANTLGGTAAPDRLTHLSVKSADRKTLDIYLLNKNQAGPSSTIDLDLSSFAGFDAPSAVGFESTDTSVGPLDVHAIPVTTNGTHVVLAMPTNSFARIAVSRPGAQTTASFAPTYAVPTAYPRQATDR